MIIKLSDINKAKRLTNMTGHSYIVIRTGEKRTDRVTIVMDR